MDWKYIAGFFDGEGSINHNGRGFRISIAQTNYEVLLEMQKFTKIGIIFENTKRKPHWKDCWTYYIANQEHVYIFLKNISNNLIVKREKTWDTLEELEIILQKQKERNNLQEQRLKKGIELRKNGLTYRQIGKELNVDFGYIRRLILNKKLR